MTVPHERTIFLEALDRTSGEDRTRYVRQACGDDAVLMANVLSLLEADRATDNPLDSPPVQWSRFADADAGAASATRVDQRVGDYRLMEKIGEGGFGQVFVAEQEKPVRRKVAFKMIKPGMGTREVIARFEAERQAVAMMDHPNIAAVFDAGVSDDGRPFFVMELVRGVPITEFADAHRLTVTQRVELFIDVCKAVHHAHQKAVIHRDIKPSNVLVTLHDDRPVVKVIDFGVAKAIGQSLTDKTIYTQFFAMMGTPLYMSPEQAEMVGLDVDIRSDIYSLGVMLYELLAGTTPIDRDRLNSAGLDEVRRIIREEEPPSPSRRLSTIGPRWTTVSADRRVEPSRLTSTLRGDLDWIVMKALEKDRNRRYDSAMALAEDLRRYLEQEPVVARPPSTLYRMSKLARRYRVVLGTASLVLLSLTGGLVASVWQMQIIATERDQKEAALREIESFSLRVTQANELVAAGESLSQAGQTDAAEVAFGEAVRQQPSYYLPFVSRGQFYAREYRLDVAADDFRKALELGSSIDTPQWWGVPSLLAVEEHEAALEIYFGRFRDRLSSLDTESSWRFIRWEWIRNGLALRGRLDKGDFAKLAQIAEGKLEARRRDFSRVPPTGATRDAPRDASRAEGFRSGRPRPVTPPRDAARVPFDAARVPFDAARVPFDATRVPFDATRVPFDATRAGERRGPPPTGNAGTAPRPVQFYIAGLAHLRAGNASKAIAYLKEAESMPHWPNPFIVHAPLAIAYSIDGDASAAAAQLQLGAGIMSEYESTENPGTAFSGTPWFDLVEMQVLYREATARFGRGR